jgi:hypothetical protein
MFSSPGELRMRDKLKKCDEDSVNERSCVMRIVMGMEMPGGDRDTNRATKRGEQRSGWRVISAAWYIVEVPEEV